MPLIDGGSDSLRRQSPYNKVLTHMVKPHWLNLLSKGWFKHMLKYLVAVEVTEVGDALPRRTGAEQAPGWRCLIKHRQGAIKQTSPDNRCKQRKVAEAEILKNLKGD